MKVLLGNILIFVFFLSVLFTYVSNFPVYDVNPGIYGILPIFSLWVWMLIDFFKRKELKNKPIWGISLIFFNWIAGIAYYVFVFRKNERNIESIESLKTKKTKLFKFVNLSLFCAYLSISQILFMSIFLTTFGIPFPGAYDLIVNKILYFPNVLFLKGIFTVANINTSTEPSFGVGLLVSLTNFIYTGVLYFVTIIMYQKIKQKNVANQ